MLPEMNHISARSKNMAAIKCKNTKPELLIRKLLHRAGFRYRLYDKKLPGKPDLVLAKFRAVIFVNGCYWHGHDCYLFRIPKTNKEFWQSKISGNQSRDLSNIIGLNHLGWKVLTIWECSIKGKEKLSSGLLLRFISDWLYFSNENFNIRGNG